MAKPRSPKSAKPPQGLPDRETLIAFLRDAGEAEKADIAKAFGLKGADRRALRQMLKGLQEDGALGKRGRKGFAAAGALPPVGVADVVERDVDGDLFVRLTKAGEDAPLVRLAPGATLTRPRPARRASVIASSSASPRSVRTSSRPG
jgi:ribonuclease R